MRLICGESLACPHVSLTRSCSGAPCAPSLSKTKVGGPRLRQDRLRTPPQPQPRRRACRASKRQCIMAFSCQHGQSDSGVRSQESEDRSQNGGWRWRSFAATEEAVPIFCNHQMVNFCLLTPDFWLLTSDLQAIAFW